MQNWIDFNFGKIENKKINNNPSQTYMGEKKDDFFLFKKNVILITHASTQMPG